MKKYTILFSIILVLLLLLNSSAALAAPPIERVNVLIGFNRPPGPSEEGLINSVGGKIKYSYQLIPAIAASIPETAIPGLLRNPKVIVIEPDLIVCATDDTIPWGIAHIGAYSVHQSGINGGGVKVAVLDSGIDYNHPDLAPVYAGGYDFVNNDTDPMDDYGHGTHVAGTIAAIYDGTGVVGVASGVELYSLKVLDSNGYGSFSDIVYALEWATGGSTLPGSIRVDITNNSYGSSADPGILVELAFFLAYYSDGVLSVAAAGNSGTADGTGDTVEYPAKYETVIAVAATDQNDNRGYFPTPYGTKYSSTGPAVEIAAPGVDILSTYLNEGFAWGSGTSMASPHVAGTAALIMSSPETVARDANNDSIYETNGDGTWANEEVRALLQATADDLGVIGKDTFYGYGLVDADEAVPQIDNDPPVAEDDAATTSEDTAVTIDVLANDDDPDLDTLTVDLVTQGSNGSVVNNGIDVTYTPDTNYNGIDTFTYTVSDGNGGTDTATVTVNVVPLEPFIDQMATGETFIDGSVVGTYVDTHANDSIIESISERTTGGKPTNRQSLLEHEWQFDVEPGVAVTFFANAWATESGDSDTFVFSYSTNRINYVEMFTITAVNDDDNYQNCPLPSDQSGTLYIRLADTNREPGNRNKDTVYIDHLFIRTYKVPPQPPLAPTELMASAISGSQIDLYWKDNANNELGYYIERSHDVESGWEPIETVGSDITTYADTGLSPEMSYHYRVQAYNIGGTSGYSNEASATTGSASTVHVSDLDGESSPGNKNRWNATVIIIVVDAYGNPVSGATVAGIWSNGVNGSGSCVTDSNGQGSITKTNIKNNINDVTFTVTNVEYPSHTYDPYSNDDPDGDSNGTIIVINTPL